MGAIVWLASYPKSGNTWMRAFLHNLLRNPAQPVHINELDRFSLGDSHRSWYAEVSKTPLEQLSDAEIIALKPAAHRRMTQAFPDSVFVKTHNRLGLAYGHPLISLDCTAGAIYVLRNPLDVVVSMAHHYVVSFLGPNAGVKVASFLGTAFLLCIAYFFFVRLNRRAGIDARFIPLELTLLFFNPLVFYQFWSAYADSLFSGEVLLAFVLIDVIMVEHERDTRSLIFLLGFVIYAAILTKFYGMILGIACPIYALLHLRSFLKHSINVKSKIALLVLVFFVLGVALVLARLGRNPTLDFAVAAPRGLGGGYAGYMVGLTDPSGHVLISSIIMLLFALVLNFHCSLPFLRWGRSRREWPLAPTCFAAIYAIVPSSWSSWTTTSTSSITSRSSGRSPPACVPRTT